MSDPSDFSPGDMPALPRGFKRKSPATPAPTAHNAAPITPAGDKSRELPPPPVATAPDPPTGQASAGAGVEASELRELLASCRVEQYVDAFVETGWDDVDYLLMLPADELHSVTVETGMKTGHAQKFMHYVQTKQREKTPYSMLALTMAPACSGSGAGSSGPAPAPPPLAPAPAANSRVYTYRSGPPPAQPSWQQQQPSPPSAGATTDDVPHLGVAYPVGTKRPKSAANVKAREAAAAKQAAAKEAAAESAAAKEAAAKEAAAKEAAAGAVSSYAASKPLSADGVLILPSGVSDPLGVDQRKLGVTVWLTEDEGVAGRWGRATWRRPDLRVRIERIDATAKTFDATAVPPGRFAVSKLPLDQCATVQLSGRELRAYEQSAKRDQLRQENADDEAKIRAERIARLGAEEVDAREAAEAARRAVALKRSAREREALKVWSPDDGDADASSSAYPLVVHNRINMSNRMSDTDLPDDLMADPEAVDVWHAAIAMKRRKGAGSLDQWVHGWRMRLVPRQTVSGYDLYIRAPDMRPETMPSKHMSSKDAIRSFSNLLEKLRERLASGASSGASAGAPPLHAVCYYAPHLGRVVLELHVTPTAPSADGDGGAAPSVPSEVHQEVEVPMEVS